MSINTRSRRPSQGLMPVSLVGAALLLGLSACSSSDDDGGSTPPDEDPVGGIFALTNRHDDSIQLRGDGQDPLPATDAGNEVVAYARFADGSLELVGEVPTGGIGENIRNSGANPLASQNPLITSENGEYLFAVNAGSDTITSLSIADDMSVSVVSTVSTAGVSGMQNPVSLTTRNGVLYVLNTGTFFTADGSAELGFVPGGTDPTRLRRDSGILGFTIGAGGTLTELAGSELTTNDFTGFAGTGNAGPGNGLLAANGGSIDFSIAGNALYITERRTDNVVTVFLDGSMLPTGAGENIDSTTDQPFGTNVVVTAGGTEVMLLSQGNNGASGVSALSSFTVGADGSLTAVSQSAGVEGDPFITGFEFGCWVESFVGGNGLTYAYTANTPNGTLTGYLVDSTTGALTRLEDPVAGMAFPNIPATGDVGGVGVLDTEIAGGFLYQVVSLGDGADATNNSRIAVFQVVPGGALIEMNDLDVENDLFVPRQFVGVTGF